MLGWNLANRTVSAHLETPLWIILNWICMIVADPENLLQQLSTDNHPIISWRWWVHSFQTFCLFHCSFWTLQALLPPLRGVLRCPREGTWNIVWKGRRPGWRAFARNIRFYFLLLFFKIRSYIFGIEQDVRAKILEGVYKSLLLKPRLKVLLTFLVHDLI